MESSLPPGVCPAPGRAATTSRVTGVMPHESSSFSFFLRSVLISPDHPLVLLAHATGNFGFPPFQRLHFENRDLERFHGNKHVLFLWTGREECCSHLAVLLHGQDKTGKCLAFVSRNEDFWFARRHRAQ